jgi:RHS repeat-associated protein
VVGESEKHRFTTYERDAESGTDYAINRQYQTITGRFMQADPFEGSYEISNPQSLNRSSYVGNDPVNFIDPLGLLRIIYWSCATVCSTYNGVTECKTDCSVDSVVDLPDLIPIGSIEIGQLQSPGQTPNIHQDFKNFLQTMSRDCKEALKRVPGVLGKLAMLANTAQIYDVNKIQSEPASRYFGAGAGRQTVGQYFERKAPPGGALTVVGVPRPGIYVRGGESAFATGEGGMYFLLHEMTHLAYPRGGDLDASLGRQLGVVRRRLPGGDRETWSQAVSRFF